MSGHARRAGAGDPIVVGGSYWTVNGVNIFSANLVRRLNELGGDARVLLTEENTDLISAREVRMPIPPDVPFDSLGLARSAGWGSHWGRMVRYLVERAPCIYIPNSDWRHSCVCPRLPNEVVVVGVVHSDDPLHYDHVRRLGHTWNVVVAVSRTVAEKTAALCPDLAERIVTIPIGVPIPQHPPAPRPAGDRLRLMYHGVLKQHQKRVLDLPRIAQAAVDRGVPIALTIVGAGPDEVALRQAAAPLVERGVIRFHGVATPGDIGTMLAEHDVYVLASEFEGMPNALIEAMGRGCVPLVTRMTSGVPELVDDGVNGLVVPIGDMAAFAERLHALWNDAPFRHRLSAAAFATVSSGRYRVEDMVESYVTTFERARHDAAAGRFVRVPGELALPPARVAGQSLFPLFLEHYEPGIGSFPAADDAFDYQLEIRRLDGPPLARRSFSDLEADEAPVDGLPVFIACPSWADNGISRWAEDVARGLRGAGLDARLLLTEEGTSLLANPEPRLDRPTDVPFEELRLGGRDGWGARWGAMARLLENAAPCFYLPSHDWRHACVSSMLSSDVMIVGLVHADDALYLDQARRLSASWDATVATNRPALRRLRRVLPDLEDRLAMIPHGLMIPPGGNRTASDPGLGRVLIMVGPAGANAAVALVGLLHAAGTPSTAVLFDGATRAADGLRRAGAQVVSRPNRQQWLALCQAHALLVAAPTHVDDARLVVEAMAHGCVPVIGPSSAGTLAIKGLSDGESGCLVAGDVGAVAARLAGLVAEPAQWLRLSRGAQQAVAEGHYSSEQMIASLVQLLRRIRANAVAGAGPVRAARFEPPPQAVDGTSVLPIAYPFESPLGRFPSRADADAFVAEREGRARKKFLWFFEGD